MSSVVGEGGHGEQDHLLVQRQASSAPGEMALGAGEPGRRGRDQKVNGEHVHEWRPFTLEVPKISVEKAPVFESGCHPHSDHEYRCVQVRQQLSRE